MHVEVNEDKDLRHQKGKPAKKTKETNCGKKGSSKGKKLKANVYSLV